MTTQITARQSTVLKLATGQSSALQAEQILAVKAGETFEVLAYRAADANHTYCSFGRGYGAQNRNSWYIYQPHFDGFKTGVLKATLRPSGGRDQYGGCMFALLVTMDSETVLIKCGSGQPGHDPVPVSQDYPGSMNPLCQGLYVIEKPVREDVSSCDPAIGPVWMALTPQEETNGRGGFLIHQDFNWERSPGTAGCIFPQRNRDIYTLADMVDRSTEATLSVEYGF